MTPTLKIPSPPRLHRAAVAAEAARGGIGDALAVGGAGERGLVLEERGRGVAVGRELEGVGVAVEADVLEEIEVVSNFCILVLFKNIFYK